MDDERVHGQTNQLHDIVIGVHPMCTYMRTLMDDNHYGVFLQLLNICRGSSTFLSQSRKDSFQTILHPLLSPSSSHTHPTWPINITPVFADGREVSTSLLSPLYGNSCNAQCYI